MTRPLLWCALFLLLWGGGAAGAPASETPDRPLVLLLLPGTSLADWRFADAPTLHHLMATGSVAVMNTRTARLPDDHRRETPESAALTLGAGSRAAGGPEITDFHPTSDPSLLAGVTYGGLFRRRSASRPTARGAVNVQWPRVVRENASLGYDLLPGDLGTALAAHGVPTVAGGGLMAAAVAADRDGGVDVFVTGASVPHPLPRFLVWDAGADVARADATLRDMVPEIETRRGRIIIACSSVNDTQFRRGERLAPVLVWGAGVPPGLLYSPSTRRAGLITNTDVAPSVTAFFGDAAGRPWLPAAPFGRAWSFVPRTDAVSRVTSLERDAYRQSAGMKILPGVAVCLGVLLLALSYRVPALKPSGSASASRAVDKETPSGAADRHGALCWLPGAIIFALVVSPTPLAAALVSGGLSLVCGVVQRRLGAARLVLGTATLTALTLVIDMLTGDRLMQHTLLGYSAVEGARYYGIGNEAMGPLVGSALVAGALWTGGRRQRLVTATVFLGVALLLGIPSAGAKAGGLLVALGAFTTFVWTAAGGRMSGRLVLGLVVTVLMTLAVISLFDWHHPAGARTHIGAAVGRISVGGLGEAWDIVQRKLSVEGRLIYHSAWAVPLWAGVFGFVRYRRHRLGGGIRSYALFSGGAVGMIACLAVNDAGVVAAALCGSVVLAGLLAGQTEERPMSTAAAA